MNSDVKMLSGLSEEKALNNCWMSWSLNIEEDFSVIKVVNSLLEKYLSPFDFFFSTILSISINNEAVIPDFSARISLSLIINGWSVRELAIKPFFIKSSSSV